MVLAQGGLGQFASENPLIERVYIVRRSDVMAGEYPCAEPVVLVDLSLAHRHVGVRTVELVDAPDDPSCAPPLTIAIPLFVVDVREAPLYEAVRPAVVVRDLRGEGAVTFH